MTKLGRNTVFEHYIVLFLNNPHICSTKTTYTINHKGISRVHGTYVGIIQNEGSVFQNCVPKQLIPNLIYLGRLCHKAE
jgi:hypothetical protein